MLRKALVSVVGGAILSLGFVVAAAADGPGAAPALGEAPLPAGPAPVYKDAERGPGMAAEAGPGPLYKDAERGLSPGPVYKDAERGPGPGPVYKDAERRPTYTGGPIYKDRERFAEPAPAPRAHRRHHAAQPDHPNGYGNGYGPGPRAYGPPPAGAYGPDRNGHAPAPRRVPVQQETWAEPERAPYAGAAAHRGPAMEPEVQYAPAGRGTRESPRQVGPGMYAPR